MTISEIADRIRKEVESLAKPGEKWAVSGGTRISVSLFNPKKQDQGHGVGIDASNCDEVGSVMESLRSYWEAQAREDEEYEKALSEKCKPEA